MPTFYEFFAGGGMARAGLGPGWTCLFANDVDPRKAFSYKANWGGDRLKVASIADLTARDLPGMADLAWASFPCQDLSLAGAGAGLGGARSGLFYEFHRLLQALDREARAPSLVAIENVTGLLTSNQGRDFAAVLKALQAIGYRAGAIVLDAEAFLPQSRPRLFILAAHRRLGAIDGGDSGEAPDCPALDRALARLPDATRAGLIHWSPPAPPRRNMALADLLEPDADVPWRDQDATDRLLALMTPRHREKLAAAARDGGRAVGTIFRRTRRDPDGRRRQRAEARFDGVAGCLRTPAGGSSRQTIIVVEGSRIRTRLLTAREAARLMGLDDGYILPPSANAGLALTGDGVAVPVVRHIAAHLFEPLLAKARAAARGLGRG